MVISVLLVFLIITLAAAYFRGNGDVNYFSTDEYDDLTSIEVGFVITETVLFLFILLILIIKLW